MGTEAENISKYLKTKEIQLPSNNKWLLDCISWYKSHSEVRNIYHSLQDYVCIQWLLSDLKDVQQRCLPTNCKHLNTELPGRYCVQVNWVRDISQPCYTQLQAMKNNNIEDSNENVSAEETKKQNWEPNPKRVLMMEITDGFTTLKAMEHSPIAKLVEPFIPGFKVVLIGPIECRKGILFLKSNNITVLGGEVDYMGDINSKESILSRCLNITPSESNNSSGSNSNRPAVSLPPPPPPTFDNRPQLEPMMNDVDQLPDSTSFIDSNNHQDNQDHYVALMEDDNDLFCQLPDTMFNDNFNQPVNQLSPVLDHNSPEIVHSSVENIPEETRLSPIRPKNHNRPKLFPSMEDLRPERESSLSTTLNKNLNNRSESSSSTGVRVSNTNTLNRQAAYESNKELSVSPSSAKSENKSGLQNRPAEIPQNHKNLNDSISDQIDDMLNKTGEVVYPQFKKTKVKVLSITKVKIKNSEWICCASVRIEDEPHDVTFSNKALEKFFGTSAAEVEGLRSEMSKNPSLKEKINYILKTGQTKLKLLNCLMVVEYSSEGCIPNIVSIHEE
ncbi:recQ-mediated genome instability protein 1-like [Macrosteles quadrilineatus]|uniref:recQ-mediated genome instability protein 1-like n=1 Tax=Macrosteles quadrilineatus TaxID=74068 RepID=UPI0023E2A921|nr:recQ-mediated genome instability protein 1-like [Macrosteles quadrilineatus]